MHWCPLKRSESLTDNQSISLRELLAYNLESVRAYKCTVAVMSRFVLNAMPGETRTLRGRSLPTYKRSLSHIGKSAHLC